MHPLLQMHTLGVGSIPRSIAVALENDLVDTCKAGDDVVVTGTLTRRWSRIQQGARCELEVLILANHVRVVSDSHAGGIVTDGECRASSTWRVGASPTHAQSQEPVQGTLVTRGSPSVFD